MATRTWRREEKEQKTTIREEEEQASWPGAEAFVEQPARRCAAARKSGAGFVAARGREVECGCGEGAHDYA